MITLHVKQGFSFYFFHKKITGCWQSLAIKYLSFPSSFFFFLHLHLDLVVKQMILHMVYCLGGPAAEKIVLLSSNSSNCLQYNIMGLNIFYTFSTYLLLHYVISCSSGLCTIHLMFLRLKLPCMSASALESRSISFIVMYWKEWALVVKNIVSISNEERGSLL